MNKLVFVIALSLVCAKLPSQNRLTKQAKFGFKLGTGLQTITGNFIKTKPRVAFAGGFWVQLKIAKRWNMQAEIYNISKGTGLGLQQPKLGDYWLRMSYFEMPILFQYIKKNAFIEMGPSIAALINTGEYTTGGILPYQEELYPFSKKDLSLNLGAGYVFSSKWSLCLRVSHSLLLVRKQLPASTRQIYNRGLVLAFNRHLNFKAHKNREAENQ